MILGPTRSPIRWLPGIMRPDSESDNSLPSTVEVKRAWRYISTPSCALIAYIGTASSPYLYTVEEHARKLAGGCPR